MHIQYSPLFVSDMRHATAFPAPTLSSDVECLVEPYCGSDGIVSSIGESHV